MDAVLLNMDNCFNEFSKKQNGTLDIEEFKSLCNVLFVNSSGKKYPLDEIKVKHIFDVFDKNQDNFIDKSEFQYCWEKWIRIILNPTCAFIIVDVQNDFISGSLSISQCPAKQDGKDVIEPINNILNTIKFDSVFYTLDWHPEDHISFIDNVSKREIDSNSSITADKAKVFDTVIFKGDKPKEQILWPKHCVKDSWGAELHKDLKILENAIMIYKGTNSDVDSYSAFWDNAHLSETNLHKELQYRNITDVYICGIALDICAGNTTLHALDYGYRTVIVEDSCIGTDWDGMKKMKNDIIHKHGVVVTSKEVNDMVNGLDRKFELGYKLALEIKQKSF